jgi:ABC-type antimicrobial peptide transport system permease subunit
VEESGLIDSMTLVQYKAVVNLNCNPTCPAQTIMSHWVRKLASILYGLKPRDPLTLAAAIAGIVAVGLTASFLPAMRAANIHPVAALREE